MNEEPMNGAKPYLKDVRRNSDWPFWQTFVHTWIGPAVPALLIATAIVIATALIRMLDVPPPIEEGMRALLLFLEGIPSIVAFKIFARIIWTV